MILIGNNIKSSLRTSSSVFVVQQILDCTTNSSLKNEQTV